MLQDFGPLCIKGFYFYCFIFCYDLNFWQFWLSIKNTIIILINGLLQFFYLRRVSSNLKLLKKVLVPHTIRHFVLTASKILNKVFHSTFFDILCLTSVNRQNPVMFWSQKVQKLPVVIKRHFKKKLLRDINGTKYSRMNQVKFVVNGL